MIYNFFYRKIQNLIALMIGRNNDFNKDLNNLIQEKNYQEIHDIGGSDGFIVKYLNLKKKKYFCYDPNIYYINLGKRKNKKKKKYFFHKQIY